MPAVTEIVSVALLLPNEASITPAGATTAALLVMLPVAVALTMPVTVNVTDEPDASVPVVLAMLPVPEFPEVPQPLPPEGAHDQFQPESNAGRVSFTVAVVALGPWLVTVTVYLTWLPG